jgi:tRNA(Ile)-lysidine synthase
MAASRKFRSTDLLPSVAAGCLARHVGQNDRLLVGLSGGIDSIVLLHVVRSLVRSVSAVHVHHGLSENADRWEVFCREQCAAWSVPLQVARVDVEQGSADGLEAAARRVRHDVFASADVDWILLAHHRGDRAETMMFNLLRGAGVRGAGAMPERKGRLLRPLLSVGRTEIAEYAKTHGLSWVDDQSNADTRYSRNFIRQDILPAIQTRFPAAEVQLASAAARFAEAADLLDDLARLDIGAGPHAFPIALRLLAGLTESRARNVLRFLLACHGVGIPSEDRLVEILRQCLDAAPDRHPAQVFGNYVLRRKAGQLVLETL